MRPSTDYAAVLLALRLRALPSATTLACLRHKPYPRQSAPAPSVLAGSTHAPGADVARGKEIV
jgi:hypothetical protein